MEEVVEALEADEKETEQTEKAGIDKTRLITVIVVAVLMLLAVVALVVTILTSGKKSGANVDADEVAAWLEDEDGAKKWVGSDEYGYIEVPERWSAILDSDEGVQYGSSKIKGASGYYISLVARSAEDVGAKEWAEQLENLFKEVGFQDVEAFTAELDGKTAYAVTGYYESDSSSAYHSRWMTSYALDAGNGKTYYVSVEGPDKDNAAFKIPETFKLAK